MGKKNKKAGGNTKKVKETTAVSVESSKPNTPELHPHSLPDSTVTPDEPAAEAESTGVSHEDGSASKNSVNGDEEVVSVNGTGQDGGMAEATDQEVADEPTLDLEDRSRTPSSEPAEPAEPAEADIVPKEVSDIVAPEVVPDTMEMEPELEIAGNEDQEVEADLAEIPLQPEDAHVSSPPSSSVQVDVPSPSEIRHDSDIESGVEAIHLHDVPSTNETTTTNLEPQSPPRVHPAEETNGIVNESVQETGPEQPPISTPPPPRSPSFRELLPSKSNPRTPSPNLSREESEAGPSRRISTSSHRSSPRRTPTPSRSEFTSPIKSPRHIPFHAPKPTIPASAPIIVTGGNDDVGDDSTPFESIPLQTTPPGLSIPLPLSPGLHPGNGHGHDSAPPSSRLSITIPPSRPLSVQLSRGDTPATPEKKEAPRLHAPPAHPHPFPIPSTSPRPSHEKRPSHSHAGPSGGLGVKGVSTFEKVISHTRPSWLPPKDRVEDEIHYHQWEEMMSQAREAEKEKRKIEEAKRAERDKRLAINTPKWEEMLDEKTFNADRIRKDPALRQIWFEGCPTYLRGKAWSLAIGNPLALSKDLYRSCVARSKKAIASGRFPSDILERIETDLDKTLVNLHLFQHGSPLRADLHELICAWVVYRSDTALGYASHINLLAALFLLSSPPATAFLSLINLLSRPVLRAFYSETRDEIDAFYRVFENLQADTFPKIFANCKNLGLKVPESWFRSVLVEQVPFEAACRLWDQIVLDGDGYIFRSALAIFGFLEPRLYFPDRDEIASILEGRNHATQAIVDREKERAKLRGETYLDELDGKLSVFGLNEQALFDWLADDGWKEARFERLVTREMPD